MASTMEAYRDRGNLATATSGRNKNGTLYVYCTRTAPQ